MAIYLNDPDAERRWQRLQAISQIVGGLTQGFQQRRERKEARTESTLADTIDAVNKGYIQPNDATLQALLDQYRKQNPQGADLYGRILSSMSQDGIPWEVAVRRDKDRAYRAWQESLGSVPQTTPQPVIDPTAPPTMALGPMGMPMPIPQVRTEQVPRPPQDLTQDAFNRMSPLDKTRYLQAFPEIALQLGLVEAPPPSPFEKGISEAQMMFRQLDPQQQSLWAQCEAGIQEACTQLSPEHLQVLTASKLQAETESQEALERQRLGETPPGRAQTEQRQAAASLSRSREEEIRTEPRHRPSDKRRGKKGRGAVFGPGDKTALKNKYATKETLRAFKSLRPDINMPKLRKAIDAEIQQATQEARSQFPNATPDEIRKYVEAQIEEVVAKASQGNAY